LFQGRGNGKIKANKSKDEGKEEIPLIWNNHRQSEAVKRLQLCDLCIRSLPLELSRNQLCNPLLLDEKSNVHRETLPPTIHLDSRMRR
jgi:hypothetical protein